VKYIRNEKGFTLIELMVVILIIGILVAIAVPVFNSARESAYKSTCQANLRTIDGALQTWKAANPNLPYPTTIDDVKAALVPDYIKTWPSCPQGGATGGAYTVAAGADGSSAPTIVCPNGHTYP